MTKPWGEKDFCVAKLLELYYIVQYLYHVLYSVFIVYSVSTF